MRKGRPPEDTRTANRIIEAVRARGGGPPRDLRYAAHEAHHALELRLRAGRWDPEVIHRAITKRGRVFAVTTEIGARAVEQIVCGELGVDPDGDIDRWARVAWHEAYQNSGIDMPSIAWIASMVRKVMRTPATRAAVDAVLRLGAID